MEKLFRGKRVDNGEWVEGICVGECDNKHYMFASEFVGGIPDLIEIDPETKCQYIGFEDKNCKKIFEKDLLDFDEDVWGGPFIPEVVPSIAEIIKDGLFGTISDIAKYRAVVGTIYD